MQRYYESFNAKVSLIPYKNGLSYVVLAVSAFGIPFCWYFLKIWPDASQGVKCGLPPKNVRKNVGSNSKNAHKCLLFMLQVLSGRQCFN